MRHDLRILPSELVTKDIDEDHKVHEIDPDHVRDTYVEEFWQRADGEDPSPIPRHQDARLDNDWEMPPVGKVVKFTNQSREKNQKQIDIFRLRVAAVALDNLQDKIFAGRISENEETIFHLWWPKNNLNEYEKKPGRPPPDSVRPKHLRGYDLVVDLNNPVPARIESAIRINNPELLESVGVH